MACSDLPCLVARGKTLDLPDTPAYSQVHQYSASIIHGFSKKTRVRFQSKSFLVSERHRRNRPSSASSQIPIVLKPTPKLREPAQGSS